MVAARNILQRVILWFVPVLRNFVLPRWPHIYFYLIKVGRPLLRAISVNVQQQDNDWLLWGQDLSKEIECKTIMIVVRDIIMPDRATSYARLDRIVTHFIENEKEVVILVLNEKEKQKTIWGLNDLTFDLYVGRLARQGVGILISPSQMQLLSTLSKFPHIWLHDVKVAVDFLMLTGGKIPFRQIIFDTVDLSFRRATSELDSDIEKSTYKAIAAISDKVIAISEEEKKICALELGVAEEKLHVVSVIYPEFINPNTRQGHADYDAIFVGNFLHFPNIDAIQYLCDEIIPHLTNVKIAIIGPNLPKHLQRKLALANIEYQGYVKEINQIYCKTKLVIVPLRLGAGVKGKVIEALNQAVPVITTEIGAQGISNLSGKNLMIVRSTTEFVELVNNMAKNTFDRCDFTEQELVYLNNRFGVGQLKEICSWIN